MKNKFFITLITVSAFVTVMLFACKKKDATPATPNINVGFHFHTWIGGNCLCVPYSPGTYLQDSLGRWIQLAEAQFYINNIAIHVAGNWVQIPGQVLMKRLENEIYPLTATIPQGSIDSVKFTVGLGNALNSQAPTAFSTTSANDSVLSSLETTSAMYNMWGSGMAGMAGMASGYDLMYLVGLDSIAPGNIVNFHYEVGGYGDTVNVVLGYAGGFNFVPVQPSPGINLIHMVIDYGKLLQLAVPAFTPGTNTNSTFYGPNPGPANSIFNILQNYPNESIFHWECTPPINC